EVFVLWNAIVRLGAVVVPVSYRSKAPEVAYLLSDSSSKVLLSADAALADRALREAGHTVTAIAVDDPRFSSGATTPVREEFLGSFIVWMHYTSGTTGRPKGILRAPPQPTRTVPANPYMAFWGLGRDDVYVLTGPAYHTAPGAYAVMHLNEGAA